MKFDGQVSTASTSATGDARRVRLGAHRLTLQRRRERVCALDENERSGVALEDEWTCPREGIRRRHVRRALIRRISPFFDHANRRDVFVLDVPGLAARELSADAVSAIDPALLDDLDRCIACLARAAAVGLPFRISRRPL